MGGCGHGGGGGSVLFIVRGPFLQSCVLLWSRGSRVLCIALFEGFPACLTIKGVHV